MYEINEKMKMDLRIVSGAVIIPSKSGMHYLAN